jgi:hypothetical protein
MPSDYLSSDRPPVDASDAKIATKMDLESSNPASAAAPESAMAPASAAAELSAVSAVSAASTPTTADEENRKDSVNTNSGTLLAASNVPGQGDPSTSITAKLRGTSTVRTTHPGSGSGRAEPIYVEDDVRFEKEHFVMPKHYQDSLGYILMPKGLVNDRIEKLAMEIRRE